MACVLGSQIAAAGRSAEAYTVNTAHPSVMYELAFVQVEPGTGFPSLELYQSADGGQTWQLVLQRLPELSPFSSAAILTGSENPGVVYLTNTRCSAAQAFHAGYQAAFLPLAGSGYSICMSNDGGKSWKTVLAPSQFAQTMGGGVIDRQGRLYAQATTSGTGEIWRYDPATATWSKVTHAPQEGSVLAATPISANGTTALWQRRSVWVVSCSQTCLN